MRYLKLAFAATILLAVLAIFFNTVIFQQHIFIHTGLFQSDLLTFNYPVRHILQQELEKSQQVPYWTDLLGNGFPLYAESQLSPYYPFNYLPALFNFNAFVSTSWLTLAHIFLWGIGIYLYVKCILNVSSATAVIVATAGMFCGYIISFIHHTNVLFVASYLPMLMFVLDKLLSQPQFKPYNTVILSLTLFLTTTLMIYAGHIETAYYNLLFLSLYALLLLFLNGTWTLATYLKAVLCIVIISCAVLTNYNQFIHTYETTKLSSRSEGVSTEDASRIVWSPQTGILFLNPFAYSYFSPELWQQLPSGKSVNIQETYPYLGVIPLIGFFVAYSQKIWKRENKHLLILSILLLCVTLYALGAATQIFSIIREILPGLKLFRLPYKTIYIIQLLIILISALGINHILKRISTNTRMYYLTATALFLFTFLNLYLINAQHVITIPATHLSEKPASAEILHALAQKDVQNGFLPWRIAPYGSKPRNVEDMKDFAMQNELRGLLMANNNVFFNIPTNRIYAGLLLQSYNQINKYNLIFEQDTHTLTITDKVKKSLNLQSVRYLTSAILLEEDRDYKLYKQFKLSKPLYQDFKLATGEGIKNVKSEYINIYENQNFIPRARLIPIANLIDVSKKTDDEVENMLFSSEFSEYTQALVHAPIPELQTPTSTTSSALITPLSYSPEEVEFEVKTEDPALFILNDTWYPRWQAHLDNQPVNIHKVNLAFRGVFLPVGTHNLRFSYQR